MGMWAKEKKYLCAAGLLAITRKAFTRIKEPSVSSKKAKVPLVDCLMSGLALFGLKFPSLLKFDQRKEEPIIKHNLSTLYKIEKVPTERVSFLQKLFIVSIVVKKNIGMEAEVITIRF